MSTDTRSAKHSVHLSSDQAELLDQLTEHFQTTKSGVFRMALEQLAETVKPEAECLYKFAGNDDLVAKKRFVVRGIEKGKGLVMIARELGVTRRTIHRWLADDPDFKEAAQDGKDLSIELVEYVLFRAALVDKKLNASFGVLNAKHAQYGMVKAGFVSQKIKQFLRKQVVPEIEVFVARDKLGELVKRLREKAGRAG
jgi:predicted transcriptional regulator